MGADSGVHYMVDEIALSVAQHDTDLRIGIASIDITGKQSFLFIFIDAFPTGVPLLTHLFHLTVHPVTVNYPYGPPFPLVFASIFLNLRQEQLPVSLVPEGQFHLSITVIITEQLVVVLVSAQILDHPPFPSRPQ